MYVGLDTLDLERIAGVHTQAVEAASIPSIHFVFLHLTLGLSARDRSVLFEVKHLLKIQVQSQYYGGPSSFSFVLYVPDILL